MLMQFTKVQNISVKHQHKIIGCLSAYHWLLAITMLSLCWFTKAKFSGYTETEFFKLHFDLQFKQP